MRTTYARAPVVARPGISLAGVIYVLVGVVVAMHRHYFAHVDTVRTLGSALLAVLLWPLLFLGIDLHIR
jgi:hypothetical protein